jgi:2-amino-4-hydroxy-6-hydroxymethyldihydropteridine diphosphokinase
MSRVLVALGANLGQRHATLRQACEHLARHAAPGTFRISQLHETQPVGGPPGQEAFLNAAAAFETTLAPEGLHAELQKIEAKLGRERGERWSARLIDLDLLLYDERIVVTPQLQLPHPRMAFRRFVLEPAAEVAPGMKHPLVGWTVERLLDHLNHAPPYVAFLSSPENSPEELAATAAARVGAVYLAKPAVAPLAGPGGYPSGPTAAAPIQFFERAASLLAACDWSSGQGVISGFYVDQCLAEARAELDDAGYARVEQAWRRHQDSLVRPKLLVILDTWEALVSARTEVNPSHHFHASDGLRLAARGGQPVLCAGRSSFDEQLAEITAALTAMH